MADAMSLAGRDSATQGALASTSKNTAPLSRTALSTSESVSALTRRLRTCRQPRLSIRIPGQDIRKTGHSSKWQTLASPEASRERRHAFRSAQGSEEHTSELQSHLNLVCRLI